MKTVRWQRCTSSFDKPAVSLPKTSATSPSAARLRISGAASRACIGFGPRLRWRADTAHGKDSAVQRLVE
jgi:hypothetical protein